MLKRKTKKLMMSLALLAASLGGVAGCGVRGEPQPPLTPAELGRGEPTFQRSTEEFAFPNVPSVPVSEPSPRPRRSPAPGE